MCLLTVSARSGQRISPKCLKNLNSGFSKHALVRTRTFVRKIHRDLGYGIYKTPFEFGTVRGLFVFQKSFLDFYCAFVTERNYWKPLPYVQRFILSPISNLEVSPLSRYCFHRKFVRNVRKTHGQVRHRVSKPNNSWESLLSHMRHRNSIGTRNSKDTKTIPHLETRIDSVNTFFCTYLLQVIIGKHLYM